MCLTLDRELGDGGLMLQNHHLVAGTINQVSCPVRHQCARH